ncbi:hypothetical protein HYU91_04715 [Candidatus Collierbacteria bacterium]|nr:hypothetical protein [Candidatus Collierbacteria bacterium]
MGDFGGGIPGQVISELASIPKQVVETIASAGTVQATQPKPDDSQAPPEADRQKAEAAKRRLAVVRGELQEYYEQQKKKEEHEEAMIEEQKEQEKEQVKQSRKKQEEQEVLHRLSSQYGGTGEVAKSGN